MIRLICIIVWVAVLLGGAQVPGVDATTPLRVGPYALLIAIETTPLRAGQSFPLRICPAPGGSSLDGASVMVAAIPATGTVGASGTPLALHADGDAPGCVAGWLLIGAAGAWVLRVVVIGDAGTGDGALSLAVEESAPVPVWLGWAIGLSPLVGFAWLAVWQVRHWRQLPTVSPG